MPKLLTILALCLSLVSPAFAQQAEGMPIDRNTAAYSQYSVRIQKTRAVKSGKVRPFTFDEWLAVCSGTYAGKIQKAGGIPGLRKLGGSKGWTCNGFNR